MNTSFVIPAGVECLLVIEGASGDLREFAALAESEGVTLLSPSKLMPTPTGILDIDPFAMPYYYFSQSDYANAAASLTELNINPELAKLLMQSDSDSIRKARNLISTNLDREAYAGVNAIRENIRKFNCITKRQWYLQNVGTFKADLICSVRNFVSDNRLEYQFRIDQLSLDFPQNLAELFPNLSVGFVGVNRLAEKQAYSWYSLPSQIFQTSEEPLHPEGKSWLDEHPPVFSGQ